MFLLFLIVTVLSEQQYDCDPPEYYSFSVFCERFKKVYNTTEQYEWRQSLFDHNVTQLKKDPCCYCGITKFYDQTYQEFHADLGLFLPLDIEELVRKQEQKQNQENYIVTAANQIRFKVGNPSSLDWRQQNAVTVAKQQGTCGTCWSFATIGMAQSSLILQGRAFNTQLYQIDLSEQFLLRCTPGSTCNGGYLETALDKALQKGVPYQSEFPYQPYVYNYGLCSTRNLVKISNLSRHSVYRASDSKVINMLQDGPITAAVAASRWKGYSRGVMSCSSSDPVDHAVLLVGYTADYWIAKNSWGTDFGINGFIYISRNPNHNCKIGIAVHELSELTLTFSQLMLLFTILLMVY